MEIIYYSGVSENTHRFVEKLGVSSKRIPIKDAASLSATEEYLLIVPTYVTTRRSVPPQVVTFLNNPENRALLRGVIGTGNTNFNQDYCIAASMVAAKCEVPHLYNLELLGNSEDVEAVRGIIETFKNRTENKEQHPHEQKHLR